MSLRALKTGRSKNLGCFCKKMVMICLFWVSAGLSQGWQSENGPEGGTVNCLLLNGNFLYAGMVDGVYRLDLNSNIWHKQGNGIIPDNWINCIARLGQTIMAGSSSDGIFITTDDGDNWIKMNAGLTEYGIRALTVDSTGFFALSTQHTVYYLKNHGTTWTKIPSNASVTQPSSVKGSIAVIGNNLFASVFPYNGIYRSVRNGTIWQPDSIILKNEHCRSLLVDNGTIYAGTSNSIFRSSDSGETWQKIDSGITYKTGFSFISSINNILYTADTYGEIFRLNENTTSWISVNKTFPYAFWPTSMTGNASRLFISGYDHGVFSSVDSGSTWSPTVSGLTNRFIDDVVINGEYIFACSGNYGFGHLFVKKLTDQKWQKIDPAKYDNHALYCLTVHKSSIFAGSLDGGIYRSTDFGQTWIAVSDTTFKDSAITSLASIDSLIYAGVGNTLYKSSDNGAHWIESGTGIHSTIYGLCKAGTTFFAAGTDSVFCSVNNDSSWSFTSIIMGSRSITCVASLGKNAFVGTTGGLFTTQDAGATYTALNVGVPYTGINTLLPHKGLLFAGTISGAVLVSADTGKSWNQVGDKIPPSVNSIEMLAASEDNLYAATYLSSIQRFPLNGIVNAKPLRVRHMLNGSFTATVQQGSRPLLRVRYAHPFSGGPVKFQITDFQGRMKHEITQKITSPGSYSFSCDLGDFPAGAYLIRVKNQKTEYCKTFMLYR